MSVITRFCSLLILLIFPFILCGQNQDSIRKAQTARDLYLEARGLADEERHIEAIYKFQQALEIRKNLFGDEHFQLGSSYMGIGISHRYLGHSDLAIKNLQRAEQNYLLGDSSRVMRILAGLYQNYGIAYQTKLDYGEAERYYTRSIDIFGSQNMTPDRMAMYEYNLADVYYQTNQYDKALEIIERNIEHAYLEDMILYYELLAFIEREKGNIEAAKTNYQQVIELTGYIDNLTPLTYVPVYLNYAILLISLDQFSEADQYLNMAYEKLNESGLKTGMLWYEYYRTRGYYSVEQPIESNDIRAFNQNFEINLNKEIEFYLMALNALGYHSEPSMEILDELNNLLSVTRSIDILKLIGDVYSNLAEIKKTENSDSYVDYLNQAAETYQIVSSAIQLARKQLSNDESKIQLTALEISTYHKLVQVAHELYGVTKDQKFINLAFQTAERSKSSVVFDKISDELARENSLIPDSLLEKEKMLSSTITYYKEKKYEAENSEVPEAELIQEYSDLIFASEEELKQLNQLLLNEYSDFYDLKFSETMLTIPQVQNRMNHNEVILEYVFNEEDSIPTLHCLIIGKANCDFIQLEIDKNFSPRIESMFGFMSDEDYMNALNSESIEYCNSAYDLYNWLIVPVKEMIKDKRITIVPDGKLSYVAFDALIEELPDTTDLIRFNELSYLIRNYRFNYSNSVNLFFTSRSPQRKHKIETVAFAPEYNNEPFTVGRNRQLALTPLPGVSREVQGISEIVRTTIFSGTEASEQNFRENIERYDILHLAMHAFINDSLPAFSRLAFSQMAMNDNENEGWINTADIYNLDLNARLTVLSACNTGMGKLQKGEGIMSLARGFQYAGCPAVIMSLWEVDDLAGTEIMTSFYKNFKMGKTTDEALRLAKLQYLESANSRRAHPHYWLSFISIGDNSPLFRSYDFYFFILLIIALLGIAIDQLLRMRKARR